MILFAITAKNKPIPIGDKYEAFPREWFAMISRVIKRRIKCVVACSALVATTLAATSSASGESVGSALQYTIVMPAQSPALPQSEASGVVVAAEEVNPVQTPEPVPVPQPAGTAGMLESGETEQTNSGGMSLPLEKSLRRISVNIAASEGSLPPSAAAERFLQTEAQSLDQMRAWEPSLYLWESPAFTHRPLYFEEQRVERLGQTRFPQLAPLVSGAQFVGRTVSLPYAMAIHCPHHCVAPQSQMRPVAVKLCEPPAAPCNGHQVTPPGSHLKAAAVQAAAVTGMIMITP